MVRTRSSRSVFTSSKDSKWFLTVQEGILPAPCGAPYAPVGKLDKYVEMSQRLIQVLLPNPRAHIPVKVDHDEVDHDMVVEAEHEEADDEEADPDEADHDMVEIEEVDDEDTDPDGSDHDMAVDQAIADTKVDSQNGKWFVPVRFLAALAGGHVDWEAIQ